MTMYENYTLSQDRKIMSWNKENFEDFVSTFTGDELEEMNSYLVHHPYFPLDCEYDEEGRAGSIVCDYVRRWLYQQLEDGTFSDTKELMDIALAICCRSI